MTQMEKLRERTRKSNEYRREAQQMWELRSPTRQGWYIEARLKGKTPEAAIAAAMARPGGAR